jgi:DUF4097 and DUF4098 domain-containing protein YvlB
MTKKEIVLVIFVIVAGLLGSFIYQVHKKGFSAHLVGIDFDSFGPSKTYTEEKVLDASSALPVSVTNAFGDVRIEPGPEGKIKLVLEKVIRSSDEKRAAARAAQIKPVLEAIGGVYRVATNREDLAHSKPSFETNLKIQIPPSFPVKVGDRHGDVEIRGINADVEVNTGFSDIILSDLGGSVRVQNSHGDVVLTSIRGKAAVTNEHGDATLRDIGGDVEIHNEHSKISCVTVKGGATVETSFDDVEVANVEKDIRIQAPHCDVTVRQAGGAVEVAGSFGEVKIDGAKGLVKVTSEHGGIELDNIEGPAEVSASYENVVLKNMKDRTTVTAEHTGIETQGFFAGGRLETSYKDVQIGDLSGSLEASVESGDFSIERILAADEVKVNTLHGNITLGLVDPVKFTVIADSSHGDVDFPEAESAKQVESGREKASFGSGPGKVILTAEYGDIAVNQSAQGK